MQTQSSWKLLSELDLKPGQIYRSHVGYALVRQVKDEGRLARTVQYLSLMMNPRTDTQHVSCETIPEPVQGDWFQPMTDEEQAPIRELYRQTIGETIDFHSHKVSFWTTIKEELQP